MNKLNAMLIDALNDEWKAAFQYYIHASQFRVLHNDPISEHMKDHADDEVGHAERLSIHLLGKGVDFQVVIPEVSSSLDTVEMIAQDLQDEVTTIDKYSAILDAIGDDPKLTDTRVLIEDITTDEVEHQDENAALLKTKIDARKQAMAGGDQGAVIPDEVMAKAMNAFVRLADQSDRLAVRTNSQAFVRRANVVSTWAADCVKNG